MSNLHTTEWLEFMLEEFETTESGAKRASLIQVLHDEGFHDKAENLYSEWYEKRKLFLEEYSRSEKDVVFDEESESEFFWVESEQGNPGDEDYQNENVKADVPDELQIEPYKHIITYKNGN